MSVAFNENASRAALGRLEQGSVMGLGWSLSVIRRHIANPMIVAGSSAFTLLELLVVISVVGLLLSLSAVAAQTAWRSARTTQCQANLRQIGLAVNAYCACFGVFPFGVGADRDQAISKHYSRYNQRFSIHSQLLPYLEEGQLYDRLNFQREPFDRTVPVPPPGAGANTTVSLVSVATFLCPSDWDRMAARPWGKVSYRSCNGSSWSGRQGNGLFSQISSVRPADVQDGLACTAAFAERIRGDDSVQVDMRADLFRSPTIPWAEEPFRLWCAQLGPAEAATLFHDSNGGQSWLEGNMNWTRYNHVLTPGSPSCKMKLTWDGAAMTATSYHQHSVNVLFGDGAVRPVSDEVSTDTWRATTEPTAPLLALASPRSPAPLTLHCCRSRTSQTNPVSRFRCAMAIRPATCSPLALMVTAQPSIG